MRQEAGKQKGVSVGADHASESLQSQSGLYPRKLTVSLTGSLSAFLRSRFASPPHGSEVSHLGIFPKKFSSKMLMDLLVGLLLLIFVNGVVGEHRMKLEKGYNLQERPASEKEGEPLLIRLVTYHIVVY